MSLKTRRIVSALSFLLFIVACFLPALEFWANKILVLGAEESNLPGSKTILIGWYTLVWGWLAQKETLGWFANFFYLLALILSLTKLEPNLMRFAALIALVLSACTITMFGHEMCPLGSPPLMRLHELREGFYVWVVSICLVNLNAFIPLKETNASAK